MAKNLLNYVFLKTSKKFKFGTFIRTGKNFSGRTCVFHRGGGNKKVYRLVDFYRRLNLFGTICSIQYDAYRSAYIGLILYDNSLFSNVILADGVVVGDKIFSGDILVENYSLNKGSSSLLSNMSMFSIISNIEAKPKYGASIARAAGSGAILIAVSGNNVTLKLRSGWLITLSGKSMGTVGYVSNLLHNMKVLRKAGKSRVLGKRPIVRGVAMNPCDHPHGGGNGKTSPPSSPLTPWGKITKWVPTKNKKNDRIKRKLFKQIR